ncbi:MAG: type IV pili twitching motility protein PilT [Candidatus Levybacteria bacterium CG_4_9_14_3_um_filter_35_16]|nr:MAG: type IV pili twitching motility protein PilT [Candidatus Levybacteria bacterium CG22_combo_CG10-13_8_21_14_all_35_11]PIZ98576.1 MAG: type IV pili twitching motility protein PilT [Candidatus Levybacteria bacterium CG_4_10_14_0_2_um_filter_35_8]PJA91078.1 MAG: type IV pili twitching motility protein PilT [Candidatus Levybacteria bacterium CG_4_9_14_3_um_filter_35_16]PJC54349.1 MAG: type IV pili twitching motility protein PilT [Candidatus Levybacteria bacterium CG_4_9_14_0_2_um_filter_35_21
MTIQELLDITIKNKASDLHLLVGICPAIRIDGVLNYVTSYEALTAQDIETMLFSILKPDQKELLLNNKEIDFSFGFGGGSYGDLGRFRINLYYQRGYLSAAFRFLEPKVKTIEELRLPKICHSFADLKQGFVLVTGPTGHGKSTTLAAIINEINAKRACHILTIEDPVEYVYPIGKSIISQRELEIDTHSWAMALRSALREDPDVVLVGEMRDPETISAAITIAETGHLVFSTLHTNSASQTIDRIIDTFPATQQAQIRIQLASSLKGIVSQRLLPQISGGRVPAVEVLIGSSAILSNIREGKTHLIDSVIQTSQEEGMATLESSLASLVLSGSISLEIARSYSLRPNELMRMIG